MKEKNRGKCKRVLEYYQILTNHRREKNIFVRELGGGGDFVFRPKYRPLNVRGNFNNRNKIKKNRTGRSETEGRILAHLTQM